MTRNDADKRDKFDVIAPLQLAATADTLTARAAASTMPRFVPRLGMDCGQPVRQTVYCNDEDAGEYWRLSPDHGSLCLHTLRQVPVICTRCVRA